MNKINRLCPLIGLMIGDILLYPSFSMGQKERAWYAGDTHVHTAIHTNHNGGIDWTFEIDRNGRGQGEKDGIMDWNMEIDAKISLSSDGWIAEVAIPCAVIEWKKKIEKEV